MLPDIFYSLSLSVCDLTDEKLAKDRQGSYVLVPVTKVILNIHTCIPATYMHAYFIVRYKFPLKALSPYIKMKIIITETITF